MIKFDLDQNPCQDTSTIEADSPGHNRGVLGFVDKEVATARPVKLGNPVLVGERKAARGSSDEVELDGSSGNLGLHVSLVTGSSGGLLDLSSTGSSSGGGLVASELFLSCLLCGCGLQREFVSAR